MSAPCAREWETIFCEQEPYDIFRWMEESISNTHLVEIKGVVYEFAWKGEPYNHRSVLSVTHENGVNRTYRGGWEVQPLGFALEEVKDGWHTPGKYLRLRVREDHWVPQGV